MLETTENLGLTLMHRTDKFDTETLMANLQKIDASYGKSLDNITDAFDSTKSYVIGDYCIKDNILYKFIAEKSAGEWNESVVISTTVSNVMKEMNAAITQLNSNKVSFNTSVNPYVGDCNAITTPGPFGQLIHSTAINGTGYYAYILVFVYASTNLSQMAIGYNTDKIALRHRYDGVWSTWHII